MSRASNLASNARRARRRWPLASATRAERAVAPGVSAVVVAVVVVTAQEIERGDDLQEDVDGRVVEVERDAERNADTDRGTAVVANIADAVVEVPVPEPDPDVERQLECR